MRTKGRAWISHGDAEEIVLLRTKQASAAVSSGRWVGEGESRFCPRGKNLAIKKRCWNGVGVMLKKGSLDDGDSVRCSRRRGHGG